MHAQKRVHTHTHTHTGVGGGPGRCENPLADTKLTVSGIMGEGRGVKIEGCWGNFEG